MELADILNIKLVSANHLQAHSAPETFDYWQIRFGEKKP